MAAMAPKMSATALLPVATLATAAPVVELGVAAVVPWKPAPEVPAAVGVMLEVDDKVRELMVMLRDMLVPVPIEIVMPVMVELCMTVTEALAELCAEEVVEDEEVLPAP